MKHHGESSMWSKGGIVDHRCWGVRGPDVWRFSWCAYQRSRAVFYTIFSWGVSSLIGRVRSRPASLSLVCSDGEAATERTHSNPVKVVAVSAFNKTTVYSSSSLEPGV